MLIQRYLTENIIDTETLLNLDWTNRMLDLGFILGISATVPISPKILQTIYINTQLSPSIRLTAVLRELNSLIVPLPDPQTEDKNAEKELIERFDFLSKQLCGLKDCPGYCQESIRQIYGKVFSFVLEKCKFSCRAVILGIWAYRNVELLEEKCSLSLLTMEELEKMEKFKEVGHEETMLILKRAFECILEKGIKTDDPLAAISVSIFREVMQISMFKESDLPVVEEILTTFKEIFSPKQKESLIRLYKGVCKKITVGPAQNLLGDYGFKPKTDEKDKRTEEGGLKLSKITEDQTADSTETKKKTEIKSIEKQFEELYFELEAKIKTDHRLKAEDICERLFEMYKIDKRRLFREIEHYSFHEKPNWVSSLLWRVIAKAVHLKKMFTNDERHKMNINVTALVTNSYRRRY